MAIPKTHPRKSPMMARVLSYVIPGLGFFYTGDKIKGFVWMILGFLIIMFALSNPLAIGRGGGFAYRIQYFRIAIYLFYLAYSAEMAARDCLDYNTRLSLQEEIDYKNNLKDKGLRR